MKTGNFKSQSWKKAGHNSKLPFDVSLPPWNLFKWSFCLWVSDWIWRNFPWIASNASTMSWLTEKTFKRERERDGKLFLDCGVCYFGFFFLEKSLCWKKYILVKAAVDWNIRWNSNSEHILLRNTQNINRNHQQPVSKNKHITHILIHLCKTCFLVCSRTKAHAAELCSDIIL